MNREASRPPGEDERRARDQPRPGTVIQGGRAKAYRPLPEADRRRALSEAVDAYERGDYFLAHELLEPAWMGTADELERFLYQGLIKLAAAYVHDVRGNSAGRTKNLLGARNFLAAVVAGGGDDAGFDLTAIVTEIDGRLATATAADTEPGPPLHQRGDRSRPPNRGGLRTVPSPPDLASSPVPTDPPGAPFQGD